MSDTVVANLTLDVTKLQGSVGGISRAEYLAQVHLRVERTVAAIHDSGTLPEMLVPSLMVRVRVMLDCPESHTPEISQETVAPLAPSVCPVICIAPPGLIDTEVTLLPENPLLSVITTKHVI